MRPTLTDRELATVLAALRFWQEQPNRMAWVEGGHFDDYSPLDNDEIDGLCERLNVTEAPAVEPCPVHSPAPPITSGCRYCEAEITAHGADWWDSKDSPYCQGTVRLHQPLRRQCGDQLEPGITCAQPAGHEGAHGDRWPLPRRRWN